MSEHLYKGKEFLEAGNYIQAMREFEVAQKHNREDPEAFFLRSIAIERLLPKWFYEKLAEEGFDSELMKLPDSPYEALSKTTHKELEDIVNNSKNAPGKRSLGEKSAILNLEGNLLAYESARVQTLHHVNMAVDDVRTALRLEPSFREANELLDRLSSLQDQTVSSKSGCFIATAVYGSYDHPDVVVFRRFRDQQLLMSRSGKSFVSAYYKISPLLVAFLSRSPLCRYMVRRIILEPLRKLMDK